MTPHSPNQNSATIKPSSKKKWAIGIFLLIAAFIAMTGTWLMTTSSGAQWLLLTISRISAGSIVFVGVDGTLSTLRADSIHYTDEDLQIKIENFVLDWQPKEIVTGQLMIRHLSAKAVDVFSSPSDTQSPPLTLPDDLQLPLSISINHLSITALRVYSEKPNESDDPDFSATDFSARIHSDGLRHRLADFFIDSDFGALKMSAQLNGVKPFKLKASINFNGPTKLAESQLPASHLLANISGDLTQLHANIIVGGKLLQGDGDITLRPFAPFPVAALRLAVRDINPKIVSSDLPAASIALQADLHENNSTELVGNITITNDNVAALDQGGLPLHDLSTNLTLSDALLQLENMSMHLADNSIIAGDLSWQITQSAGTADLVVKALNPRALDSRLQAANINGNIKLKSDAAIHRGVIALKDDTLNLNAKLLHTDQTIILEELLLSRHQSALTGQGKLVLDEQELLDFEGKLTHFNLADFIEAPESDLNLALKLSGVLSPQVAGAVNFKFGDSKLSAQPVSGNGTITFKQPDHARGNINLKIGSNSLRVQGGFGKPDDRLQLKIAAPALAQFGKDIDGAFNLTANLSGSISSPKINFEMNGNNLSLPGNHSLDLISGRGHLYDESISLVINANKYRVENEDQLQYLNLTAAGKKSNHQFQLEAQVDDNIAINLMTEGGLIQPSNNNQNIKWHGQLIQFSATGPVPFTLLSSTKLELEKERIFLDTAKLAVAGGQLNINKTSWTPKQWQSQGQFSNISIRPGSDANENKESLTLGGEWDISAGNQLTGHLQIIREEGDLIFPGDVELGLQTLQVTARADNGNLSANLTIQGENIGVTEASLLLPLARQDSNWTILPEAPLNGQMSAKINDISWIAPVLDENLRSGGKFDMQVKLSGTFDTPKLNGQISGDNLALAMLDQGVRLQDGKLAANFDQSALHIDTFKFEAPKEQPPKDFLMAELEVRQNPDTEYDIPDEFQMKQAPGTLLISGTIGLTGKDSELNIDINQLPVALETNYWILASGNANVLFNENKLAFEGNVNADAGFLTQPPASQPKLADDIIISGQSPQQSDTLQLKIDVNLDLGEHFYIKASGLEGRLIGNLRIASTERETLHATGSINTRNAHFDAYGQNLSVKRGIVEFNGSLDDPGLNILAVRENLPVEAGVEVLGTVQRPRIRLVSTPNVPDSEKLSWIVAGRSLESGGVDTSLLLTAASSILGGQPGSGGITDQISQALGVDEISFRQSDNATGGNPLSNQIGTVGKRLSSRAYLSYEKGLTTASAGVTKLTYSLTPRIRIVTQAGVDSALDIFYTFQFD